MKKFYLIAGEPSGDLHGAHLIKALKKEWPEAKFYGFGGAKMQAEGLEIHQHLDQLSFMGFVEVIANLSTIRQNFKLARKKITEIQPDAIIYIDFPGFNMRMAKWSHKEGYKNYYYIAPQAWAWKPKRALQLKKTVDQLFCILPFEKKFFGNYGLSAHYVGHPLIDIIEEYKNNNPQPSLSNANQKILALLPGSRMQEITKLLPLQLQAGQKMEGYTLYIAKSHHIEYSIYQSIIEQLGVDAHIFNGPTYDLLSAAQLACVASGTATLETALFKVPQVICYKGSAITYAIAKKLVNVKYIGLANLILDKKFIAELIQYDCTVENIVGELKKLEELDFLNKLQENYRILEDQLGLGGAAIKTVEIILDDLTTPS